MSRMHACGLNNGMAVNYKNNKLYIVTPCEDCECCECADILVRFCPVCGHDSGEDTQISDTCCKCEKQINEKETAVVNEDIKICKECIRDLSNYF